jgi:hypothetical protein
LDSFIIQGPFSVAPCQTLISRFATYSSPYDGRRIDQPQVTERVSPELNETCVRGGELAGDPLGGCNVSPAGYAHMTAMLKPLAPVELLLEGGYNLTSISLSTEACMRVLLGALLLPPPNLTLTHATASASLGRRALAVC